MDIIPQNKIDSNREATKRLIFEHFFLYFHIHGDGTEWQDFDLPPPTYLYHEKLGSYYIGWAINGHFSTMRNKNYLTDIIARFMISLKGFVVERLAYKPQKDTISEETHLNPTSYELKDFSGLESIVRAKKLASQRSEPFHDHAFWAIKFHCEHLIEKQGKADYYQLLIFTFLNFEEKERSTLKAKCKSIHNWYEKRNWHIPKSRKSKMSRAENMKRVHTERREKTEQKINEILQGENASDFKKKNGTWNASKIAKHLNMDARTVRKYL